VLTSWFKSIFSILKRNRRYVEQYSSKCGKNLKLHYCWEETKSWKRGLDSASTDYNLSWEIKVKNTKIGIFVKDNPKGKAQNRFRLQRYITLGNTLIGPNITKDLEYPDFIMWARPSVPKEKTPCLMQAVSRSIGSNRAELRRWRQIPDSLNYSLMRRGFLDAISTFALY